MTLLPTRHDWHSHSNASDGTLSPSELVAHAYKHGVNVLAITDHDTTNGVAQAQAQGALLGMRVVAGCEVSCRHTLLGGYGVKKPTKTIHVLGFAPYAQNARFIDEMERTLAPVRNSRIVRAQLICDKLAMLLPLSSQTIFAHTMALAHGNVGRPHIAQALVQLGVVSDVKKAFASYLADNKSAYAPIEAPSLADAVALIHRCGGYAVLAHPTRYNISATNVRRLIIDFAQAGGDGCELPLSDQPATRQMVARIIAMHNLCVSVGSDFHGESLPHRKIGIVPDIGALKPIWDLPEFRQYA